MYDPIKLATGTKITEDVFDPDHTLDENPAVQLLQIIELLPTYARCVLYYNTSWQGDPLRVPVASPRLLVLQGIEPYRTIKTFRRFITRIVWPMHHQSGERSCYP